MKHDTSARCGTVPPHRIITPVFLILFALGLRAQTSTMAAVLDQVRANNKELLASAQRLEAQHVQERTGLSLPDPTLEYDWMNGRPAATAGVQHDLTIAQVFEFPTAYAARRTMAELKNDQHDQENIAVRRDVLLDAQRTCISLVHANKRAGLLQRRADFASRFVAGLRIRFERGAATVLDLRRAEMMEAGIIADVRSAEMERTALEQHLMELNGGIGIVFADTIYPPLDMLPSFEQVEASMEAVDPDLLILNAQAAVSAQQERLYRATGLPQFEVGYRYQGILGATYHGTHAGLVVPLWSNRNKVRQQKRWSEAYSLLTEEHRVKHFYEARHLYDRAMELQNITAAFVQRAQADDSELLLERSFSAGQISVLEYQMESLLIQQNRERALALERDHRLAVADVLSYLL
ncbi:MAG: TolC family protein [Flavobacteriales bacterium]|nr:TolC family protein [Flavobacteriales bacterium]